MKTVVIGLIIACCLSGTALRAQTATDLHEGLQVTPGTQAGEFTLSWWGRTGRTYFIQQSFDLVSWNYVPCIESGAEDVCGLNFTCTDPRQFWRLRYTDAPTGGDALTWDADEDGLGNQQELDQGLDPFDLDTDHDGYLDGGELEHGSDPLSAASVPNENLAANDDPTQTELPVYLFAQSKTVGNDWYAGYAVPSSSVSWFDDDPATTNGVESYTGNEQKWASKLLGLSYPDFSHGSNNWNKPGAYLMAVGACARSPTMAPPSATPTWPATAWAWPATLPARWPSSPGKSCANSFSTKRHGPIPTTRPRRLSVTWT